MSLHSLGWAGGLIPKLAEGASIVNVASLAGMGWWAHPKTFGGCDHCQCRFTRWDGLVGPSQNLRRGRSLSMALHSLGCAGGLFPRLAEGSSIVFVTSLAGVGG